MEKETILRDNRDFYDVVALSICKNFFGQVVRVSLDKVYCSALHMFDSEGCDIYMRINTLDIAHNSLQKEFLKLVEGGIFARVAMEMPKNVTGELNDRVEVVVEMYKFTFIIVKYERGQKYPYQFVDDPLSLPEGEKLDRFLDLKITLEK